MTKKQYGSRCLLHQLCCCLHAFPLYSCTNREADRSRQETIAAAALSSLLFHFNKERKKLHSLRFHSSPRSNRADAALCKKKKKKSRADAEEHLQSLKATISSLSPQSKPWFVVSYQTNKEHRHVIFPRTWSSILYIVVRTSGVSRMCVVGLVCLRTT